MPDPKLAPLSARSQKDAWLELYALTRDALPTPIEAEAPHRVTVNLDKAAQIEELPGGAWLARHRLSVALDEEDAEETQGAQSLPITISLRNGDPIQATVAWRMVGPIVCAPSAIHFGMLSASELPKRTTVLVKSTADQPFELVSANAGPHLKVTGLERGCEKLHKIECALVSLPDDRSRVLSGVLTLKTQRATFPEMRIPWSAFLCEEVIQ